MYIIYAFKVDRVGRTITTKLHHEHNDKTYPSCYQDKRLPGRDQIFLDLLRIKEKYPCKNKKQKSAERNASIAVELRKPQSISNLIYVVLNVKVILMSELL